MHQEMHLLPMVFANAMFNLIHMEGNLRQHMGDFATGYSQNTQEPHEY